MVKCFKELLEEEEMMVTDDIFQALWLLDDGSMIDGEFDMGMRGQDHRIIGALVEDLDPYDGIKFWDAIHDRFNAVRLCPESGIALVKEGQYLNQNQLDLLSIADYEIEEY